MDTWQKVWRVGVQPLLSSAALEALLKGLESDDPRILQRGTCSPPPLRCVLDWPVESACPIGYAFWQGERSGVANVAEVEENFSSKCHDIDQRVGEPAGCRWFLNWWDEAPRGEARVLLAQEIRLELRQRRLDAAVPA